MQRVRYHQPATAALHTHVHYYYDAEKRQSCRASSTTTHKSLRVHLLAAVVAKINRTSAKFDLPSGWFDAHGSGSVTASVIRQIGCFGCTGLTSHSHMIPDHSSSPLATAHHRSFVVVVIIIVAHHRFGFPVNGHSPGFLFHSGILPLLVWKRSPDDRSTPQQNQHHGVIFAVHRRRSNRTHTVSSREKRANGDLICADL